jgi:aminoglycoside phosphotransferase family enzyme/predicted kinase
VSIAKGLLMELTRLIEALSEPAAYPARVEDVQVHQTHISVVFLAGPFAYKVKKPVNLGFVDFTTPERRRHFCEEEVRRNRRLAPSVYLGVVPITDAAGRVRVEGPGDPVEWAVKMERLPQGASLQDRVRRGEAGAEAVRDLARRLAVFHAAAEGGPRVAAFARFAVVAGNARENFDQAAPLVGTTVSRPVFDRLWARTEAALERLRPRIEGRAERGVPRDTHGDLRLEHVFFFPERAPPNHLVVIDCIEFNERFRFADPVADMAFLVMDLLFHGRRDLAGAFADAYFTAAGDAEGRSVLHFYVAYRAAVRGKVEGMELAEKEILADERAAALARARGHWLLALGQLEEPGKRPCLVLVAGLPGTGKSTLARGLAEPTGFGVVRSDEVRKELAGVTSGRQAGGRVRGDIYTDEWNDRTYAECLRRAEALLFEGKRVVVDASFREEGRRRAFLAAAARSAVPALLLVCRADPDVVKARLQTRRGDASDADWSVYLEAARRWEEPGPLARRHLVEVATDAGPAEALAQALEALRKEELQA